MTEEVKVEQTQEVDYSPIQQKALDQGWRPKEQFEGPEDEFIDAPEFVRRGELFTKIEHQSKELKSVRKALDDLKVGQSRIREQEYDRALKSLQTARRQAFVDGETERAFAIEDQIENVKAEKEKIAQDASTPSVPEIHPEFVEWTNNNPWYMKDESMRAVADTIGAKYARSGLLPNQVLKKVEEDIRKEFPHKFTNPKAGRTSPVEGSSRSGSGRSVDVSMSEVETQIMKRLVEKGTMTEAEYRKQLKATRDI